MLNSLLVGLSIVCGCYAAPQEQQIRPNVIFFVTDDWGFNDVGFHRNTDTMTPNIDEIATTESLIISKHYVQPLCTPSRAALLTGRYPMRYGLHDGTVNYGTPFALSRYEHLLSSEFKNQDYSTHIVGKWHLGHVTWDYTPTSRDFDTFMGFYGGAIDYEQFTSKYSDVEGYDFRMERDQYLPNTEYSLYEYHSRITSIFETISNKPYNNAFDTNKPFFMYVGWQGSHQPSVAPDTYKNLYMVDVEQDATFHKHDEDTTSTSTSSKDEGRVAFQAQTTLTDELFGSIVDSIKKNGLWDNTLIIFTSDNGAGMGYGDNAPLRGGKSTLWEGGVRVPAFVTGGLLPESQRGKTMSNYAMHITDWYPTVLAACGLETLSTNALDGKNMWPVIKGTEQKELDSKQLSEIGSDREILINVDADNCDDELCGALLYGGKWKVFIADNDNSLLAESNGVASCLWERSFEVDESADILGCGVVPDDVSQVTCMCSKHVCLFDLENDPCEYYDVSEDYDELAQTLYKKLALYWDAQTEVLMDEFGTLDEDIVDPDNFGGFFEPFYDEKEYTIDTLEFEVLLSKYYNKGFDFPPGEVEQQQEQMEGEMQGQQQGQQVEVGKEQKEKDIRDEGQQQRPEEHEQSGKHQGVIGGITEFGSNLLNKKNILYIGIGVVVLFGSLLACCFGAYLRRYCTEVHGKDSVILSGFLKERKEIDMQPLRYNENSPLMAEKVIL